jgi:hypothetical protein
MIIKEGRGFAIQTAHDSPWAGWFSLRALDWINLLEVNPSLFLRQVSEFMSNLPGGVSILWDIQETKSQSNSHQQTSLENILPNLPGVSLHFKKQVNLDPIEVPLNASFHSPQAPNGNLGEMWRKGIVIWVPQPHEGWAIPGIGFAQTEQEDCVCGLLWGEATVPAPAVGHLDVDSLISALEETQLHLERGLSLRIDAGAWPQSIPFQRRKTAWRLTLTGGWEYHLSGQSWENLASGLTSLHEQLSNHLKCQVQIGVNGDTIIAGILGEQAMRLGLPWRNTLSLPPAPPSFTPGIAADPRKVSPLEARASLPKPIVSVLSDIPVTHLRVPTIPSAECVDTFIQGIEQPSAIRWLPPSMPPPGPFHAHIHWEPVESFPAVVGTRATQPLLFDWSE